MDRGVTAPNLPRPEDYPFRCDIYPRFADLDRLNHVNNVAIGFLFEEARLRFHRSAFRDIGHAAPSTLVMVQANYAFRDETFYPDPVEIGLVVARIGRSSFAYQMGMFQNGRWTSQCDATLVCLSGHAPAPISDELRGALSHYRQCEESTL